MGTYMKRFKTWNNALTLAGFDVNLVQAPVKPGDYCEICGSNETDHWRSLGDLRVCNKCARGKRDFVSGVLDPSGPTGLGVITEYVVHKVLDGSLWYNGDINSFNSKYDIFHERYGNINVKSSKLSYEKYGRYAPYWIFAYPKSGSTTPDTYICLGLDENRTKILRVFIIPPDADVVGKLAIFVAESEKSLMRVKDYEVDATPYNEVYQKLDIYSLFPFRNLNKHEVQLCECL